jgi:hypothetical protein
MRRVHGSRMGAAALLFVATTAAQADGIAIFNTGVNGAGAVLPSGTPDPHYALIAVPDGSPVPRPATVAAEHPAYVPDSPIGSAGSSWIAPAASCAISYAPGAYVYRTTFDLTGLDPATAHVDGIYGSDDTVTDVRLNGVSTGISGGAFFILIYQMHLSSGFVAGVNTLDFVVVNASTGPHGFRLNVSGQADPLAPADHVPPALMGVTDRSFPWTGSSVALSASLLGITAVDDVDGPVPVTLSPTSAPLGNTLVTASASDAAGNTTTGTFTVHVLDVTPPAISGPTPAQPTFDWHGAAIALSAAQLGLSATDDVSGAVAVTVTPASVGFGDTLVTARAVDAAANVATKTFVVHVVDVTAPVITGPTPSQPTLAWHGSAVSVTAAALGLSATDDVDGAVAVVVTPSSVGFGDTVVAAGAVDAAGNHASKSFTVHVVDVTAPVISGPAPATPAFEWLGSPIAMTAAALGLSAADDVDGAVAVGVTPTSVGLGDTVVTATAVDAAGNASTTSFTVRVRDTVAPTFVSISASPAVIAQRDHKMVPVTIRATVADAGDPSPTTRVVAVKSIDGGTVVGPSASSADWQITGDLTLLVNADRSGRGDGRRYTVYVQATDASGNKSIATVDVLVTHDSRDGDDRDGDGHNGDGHNGDGRDGDRRGCGR